MSTELSPDILSHIASGQINNRIVELLKQGSQPNMNELCKFILAQDAFKSNDPDTIKVRDRAIKLAPLSDPVLVRGASGTGKELLAQILHGARSGNFVAINVTAVTESLFESELFGHTKGSFTGAITDRAGLVAHANNGTLFFDEIGDMPLTLQPKILRLIQTRRFRMVGGNVDQMMNCRIVCATHSNLEKLVEAGLFRLDLYYRIKPFQLFVKPLAQRLDDMGLFIKDEALLNKLKYLATVEKHNFLPGNVRELEGIVRNWEVFGEI